VADTATEAPRHVPASHRLGTLAARVGGPDGAAEGARVSVGEVVDSLGDTGLGIVLLLMMLPVFITIPGLPVGVVFGCLVAVLGVQIMRGADRLRLPPRVRARTLSAAQVQRVALVAQPWVARAERWLRPGRLPGLTSPEMCRLLGLVLVIQGVALTVPLPFGNHPPALAVTAIGLGLMERDGMAIALGLVLSVLGVLWNLLLIFASAELIAWGAGQLGW
jgi:hypothetical protein